MKIDIAWIFPALLLLAPIFYAFDMHPPTKAPVPAGMMCEEKPGPTSCGGNYKFVFER